MTILSSEPFGKPNLLLGSSPLSTTNDATTFTSNGLLDAGTFGGSGDGGEEEDASSAQNPTWVARPDGIGPADNDESSAFTSNGLLDGSTQMTSQAPSTLLSVLGSHFSDSQTLIGSAFTQSPDLPSSGGNAGLLIKATTFEGKPVFIRKKKVQTDRGKKRMGTAGKVTGLLDVPLHRLMDELAVSASDPTKSAQCSSESISASSSKAHGELWVDRYRPQQYTDLVGDDRVHREVMAWVKEWDHCVFGKSKGRRKTTEDGQYLDEYRRPQEKLLLISGPPGLGKTTLAHIVAKQAGYKVFEINASDARSGSVVDERIRPSLESGAAIGSSKPVLVIVDEIDGATGAGDSSTGFIQKLIALTQDSSHKRQKNDKKERRPLLRPIICICNDLYASSLTKLRTYARIIRLTRTADIHIVKRLRDICERERLKADSRALTALVGIAQGDLRGCLNTLQFLKRREAEVTEDVVRKATHGMKEADASQISVLNDLFCPMQRKRARDLGMTGEAESRYVGRLARSIESTGAPDKVALGCFEHYPNLSKHDSTFSKYSKAMEWLGSYDLLSNGMRSEREYGLMNYLPYMIVPFYPLFQERGAQKVERPKMDWENYTKTKAHEEIYKSLSKCLRSACAREVGCFRHLLNEQILQLELSPYINRILSPPLRPVNSQIIKPEERAVLNRLVDLMVALDLRFVQDKAEDGSLIYRLDPPVDVFVTYDGKRSSDIAISRYAVRQLVANEIDARASRRQADGALAGKPERKGLLGKRLREEHTEGGSSSGVLNSGNKKQKAGRKVDIADAPPTDFFNRPIVVKSKPVSRTSLEKATSPILVVSYKFNEGNSSAVRKPVKVSSFF